MPLLVTDSFGRLHALWSQKFPSTVTTVPANANEQEVDILHMIRTISDESTK
jgi:hypothetical protein